jgi:hypothetical protein
MLSVSLSHFSILGGLHTFVVICKVGAIFRGSYQSTLKFLSNTQIGASPLLWIFLDHNATKGGIVEQAEALCTFLFLPVRVSSGLSQRPSHPLYGQSCNRGCSSQKLAVAPQFPDMETSLFGRCSTHPHIYIFFFSVTFQDPKEKNLC